MMIFDHLSLCDQIIFSLTCKTMAGMPQMLTDKERHDRDYDDYVYSRHESDLSEYYYVRRSLGCNLKHPNGNRELLPRIAAWSATNWRFCSTRSIFRPRDLLYWKEKAAFIKKFGDKVLDSGECYLEPSEITHQISPEMIRAWCFGDLWSEKKSIELPCPAHIFKHPGSRRRRRESSY